MEIVLLLLSNIVGDRIYVNLYNSSRKKIKNSPDAKSDYAWKAFALVLAKVAFVNKVAVTVASLMTKGYESILLASVVLFTLGASWLVALRLSYKSKNLKKSVLDEDKSFAFIIMASAIAYFTFVGTAIYCVAINWLDIKPIIVQLFT